MQFLGSYRYIKNVAGTAAYTLNLYHFYLNHFCYLSYWHREWLTPWFNFPYLSHVPLEFGHLL